MSSAIYPIVCGFIPVVFYYIFYTTMSTFLNTTILCAGVLLGSIVGGVLLDLFNNQKVRAVYYICSCTIAILLYKILCHSGSEWLPINVLLFSFGLTFSIGVTDLIKYTVDYFTGHISAVINGVCGLLGLVIALLCKYYAAIYYQHLLLLHIYIKAIPLLLVVGILSQNEKKSLIHFILLALSVVCLPLKINDTCYYMTIYVLFTITLIGYLLLDDMDQKETKTENYLVRVKDYYLSMNSIFTNWEFYFYLFFLVANTLGMRSGFNALVFKKNMFFVQLGSAGCSLLYYFFLPKFSMNRITWVLLIFLNFLIYFTAFSTSIVWYLLFGICGASVFLTFIHGMQYGKHMGIVFGLFHLTMYLTNNFFQRFILYYNHDKFLTKDLHIILLQINKKVILHLYGYHLPLIIVTLITLIFYYYHISKSSKK